MEDLKYFCSLEAWGLNIQMWFWNHTKGSSNDNDVRLSLMSTLVFSSSHLLLIIMIVIMTFVVDRQQKYFLHDKHFDVLNTIPSPRCPGNPENGGKTCSGCNCPSWDFVTLIKETEKNSNKQITIILPNPTVKSPDSDPLFYSSVQCMQCTGYRSAPINMWAGVPQP